jgi:hypothetical protein
MSMGSWLKTRRKQIITHTLIVGAFLLFLLFLSEPLFDRLERLDRIPGEAQLHQIQLPTETDDIMYAFDISTEDPRVVVIERSWAFIKGEDSENSKVYIVLKSASQTYIFDTHAEERPDVTRHFQELGLNLDYSGFMTLIPARKIDNGEYTVGIYITKGDIGALQYTDRAITKSGGTLETE